MNGNYNPDIAEAVRAFLNDDGWHYDFDDDKGLFRFSLHMPGNLSCIQFAVDVGRKDYTVYAISPLSASRDDPEQMAKMAEFICRANYGLRDGSFEMDFSDGEIRYKCYVNCDGVLPAREITARSIRCPAAMYSRYGAGIIQVLFCGMFPADAVRMCERDEEDPAGDPGEDSGDGAGGGPESAETAARVREILSRRLRGGGESAGEVPAGPSGGKKRAKKRAEGNDEK